MGATYTLGRENEYTMKNAQRINALREQYRKSISKQQKGEIQQASEAKTEAAIILERTDLLLRNMYDVLYRKIYTSCGLESPVSLPLINGDVFSHDASRKRAIQQLFKEKSGLEIQETLPRCYVHLHLSDEVKTCTVSLPENWRTTLNFPVLVAENARRLRLWATHFDETVKHAIDRIEASLEAMSYKHYGTPRTVFLRHPDGTTPFSSLQVGNMKVKYYSLSSSQIGEFITAVNHRISHAEVVVKRGDAFSFDVLIRRKPGSPVPNAYFDYGQFCSTYDVLTPGLQDVLDAIARKIKFADAIYQIQNLMISRKAFYRIESQNEIELDFIINGLLVYHQETLVDALQKSIPGIQICHVDIKHMYPDEGERTGYFQIIFDVRIDETAQKYDKRVQQQLQVENLINNIKKRRVQYIAKGIIKQALDDFCSVLDPDSSIDPIRIYTLRDKADFFIKPDRSIINQLKRITSQNDIKLSQISFPLDDSKFIKRVEEAVWTQSARFIEVNIDESQYQFVFSKQT